MSPAPKKPAAAKAPRKPRAAQRKPAAAAKPKPAAAPAATTPGATGAGLAPPIPASPRLAAGTGLPVAGGFASAPLPTLTRERPPATVAPTPLAAIPAPTPGAALPRGSGLDEERPRPLQIARVVAAPLETGLSDYAFWAEYLVDHAPKPPPPGGFRRGRVWR